ncbi:MAG: phycobilisome rod-core linker polypeptide CpcG2 [Oscillatoriales cyanobacterium SM2_2_1]|nr:phycobilisome rod-core linker polypeptide CpcG2 [Oscillatoriales cyanobacterium SM2_2_1]
MLPLLAYKPTTQNHRVDGYEVGNDDTPALYRRENLTSPSAVDELLWASYRQIYSEHEILDSFRQPFLESQFRNGMITVRELVRGLGKAEPFYRMVVETNSNYRIVEICLKRFLGRAPYNRDETIAWSIAIAQKGIGGFIDLLLDSNEYQQTFGENTLPYQRRRMKERPFNLVTPRYSDYWRTKQEQDYPKQGDIRNFLDLARQLNPKGQKPVAPASVANVRLLDMTTDKPATKVPASIRGSFSFPVR